MVTSEYGLNILELDENPGTNKEITQNKLHSFALTQLTYAQIETMEMPPLILKCLVVFRNHCLEQAASLGSSVTLQYVIDNNTNEKQ